MTENKMFCFQCQETAKGTDVYKRQTQLICKLKAR